MTNAELLELSENIISSMATTIVKVVENLDDAPDSIAMLEADFDQYIIELNHWRDKDE